MVQNNEVLFGIHIRMKGCLREEGTRDLLAGRVCPKGWLMFHVPLCPFYFLSLDFFLDPKRWHRLTKQRPAGWLSPAAFLSFSFSLPLSARENPFRLSPFLPAFLQGFPELGGGRLVGGVRGPHEAVVAKVHRPQQVPSRRDTCRHKKMIHQETIRSTIDNKCN